jgi:hypothetical protein
VTAGFPLAPKPPRDLELEVRIAASKEGDADAIRLGLTALDARGHSNAFVERRVAEWKSSQAKRKD